MRAFSSRSRYLLGASLLVAAAVFAACDNNGSTGPSGQRTFNQVQRLGNPLVSEVFLAKRDHPYHGAIGPDRDVAAFGAEVAAFPTAFGRDPAIGNALAGVLLPDELVIQTDKDPATAGWLSWLDLPPTFNNGWGGRKLSDDVVDVGVTGIFSPLLGDASNALCDPFQLPLCTDNVPAHTNYQSTFPYLGDPS